MASEKRLIDANLVLGEIEHDLVCYEIGKLEKTDVLFVDLRDVVRMVCDAPTVDAVEVVRCKDCQQMLQKGWCSLHNTPMAQEDFCSYGERKDDT